MSIVLECGACKKKLKAAEKLAGKRVRCQCGAAVPVPVPVPLPPTEPEPEVADLTDLLYGEKADEEACPSCGAGLAGNAVICTVCGFNRKTGKKLSATVVEGGVEPVPEPGERAAKTIAKKDVNPERVTAVFKVIKVLVILGVLTGVGFLVYFIKDGLSFNPHQQAKDRMAKVGPMMTIPQVVTVMEGKPQEVWAMQNAPNGGLKDMRIGYAEDFLKHHGPKKLQNGFRFVYIFSQRDQVYIYFSPNGTVAQVELFDPMKMLGM